MAFQIWDTPFSSVETLICDGIVSNGERNLVILLAEHHAIGPPHMAQSDDPIERVLEGSWPVEKTPWSRKWEVVFDEAVAVKLTDEAYYISANADDPVVPSARSVIIENSPWLAKLAQGCMLDAVTPGCRHYVVFSSHTVIEVVSPRDPVVNCALTGGVRDVQI